MREKVRARSVKVKRGNGEAVKKTVPTKEMPAVAHVSEESDTSVPSKARQSVTVATKLGGVFGDSSTKAVTPKPKLAVDSVVINAIVERAKEVLGSRDEAYRWLGTPVRGLDFATPIYVLSTKGGVARVKDILGQMEHGIW